MSRVVLNFRVNANAAERLRHNAFHDPLTDLPNRTLLWTVEQAVQHKKGTRITCCSSWILIFKIVNDSSAT